jgi:hypothetical protein
MDTPTPAGINEQHVWGGTVYHYPDSSSNLNIEQPALVGPQDPAPAFPPSSQVPFIASSSDDLFHPDSGGPSFVPYRLPPVPNIHAYNPNYPHFSQIPNNRNHLSQPPRFLPYSPSVSSYNNPNFIIPPPHYPQQNYHQNSNQSHYQSPPTNPPYHSQYNPLGPPPPIPPKPSSLFPTSSSAYIPVPNQKFQNSSLSPNPVQYVYCLPPPSTLPAVPSSPPSKPLPSVSHLPTLTNKYDFFAWDEGVTALLRAYGLFGHIMDPLAPLDSSRPDIVPAPLPILPANPSPTDIAALSRWWEADNAAQHILVTKIGSTPRGLLPSSNMVARTALSIYQTLVRYYGTCSFSDCAVLLNTLHSTPCQPGCVQEFVSKWRTGLSRIRSTNFPFSIKMCLNQFVCVSQISPPSIPYVLISRPMSLVLMIRISVHLLLLRRKRWNWTLSSDLFFQQLVFLAPR